METKIKCGAWNPSMTESQTKELVRKFLCGRKFRHAYLGDACIGGYDDYIDASPAVFAIWFEYCPGAAYVTLEEFLCDDYCSQAYDSDYEEIVRIFGPYVANWKAREEEDAQKYYEKALSSLAEMEYLRTHGANSSTVLKKGEPRKSIKIVINRSFSDDEVGQSQ